jgi:hypothetical protein
MQPPAHVSRAVAVSERAGDDMLHCQPAPVKPCTVARLTGCRFRPQNSFTHATAALRGLPAGSSGSLDEGHSAESAHGGTRAGTVVDVASTPVGMPSSRDVSAGGVLTQAGLTSSSTLASQTPPQFQRQSQPEAAASERRVHLPLRAAATAPGVQEHTSAEPRAPSGAPGVALPARAFGAREGIRDHMPTLSSRGASEDTQLNSPVAGSAATPVRRAQAMKASYERARSPSSPTRRAIPLKPFVFCIFVCTHF